MKIKLTNSQNQIHGESKYKNKQITHTLKGFWAKSSKPKDDLDMNKS